MLHAHGPEEIKHFGKHLFATFLGLLMALGLESWHQDRHARHMAHVALESVEQESAHNRESLRRLTASYKEAPANLNQVGELLRGMLAARAAHQPWRPTESSLKIHFLLSHTAGSMKSAAWTMALASQSVQRFPAGKAEKFATMYEQILRLQAFLDQPVDYSVLTATAPPSESVSLKAHLETLETADARRILWGLQELTVRVQIIQQWSASLADMH